MSDTDAHECNPNCRYYGMRYLHDVCVPRVHSEPLCSCAPSPAEAIIYERGGYMRLDDIQRLASSTTDARGDRLMTALERARLVREAFDMLPLEAKVVAVEAGAEHWRKAEAREDSRFCNQDGHRWSNGRCAFCGADRVHEERRGGPAVEKAADGTTASCWQCEAPLGTTEACLTCAAKRREDTQRTPTES